MLPARYIEGDYFYTLDQIEDSNQRLIQIVDIEGAESITDWLIRLTDEGYYISIDTEFDDVNIKEENPIGKGTVITAQFTIEDADRTSVWVDCQPAGVLDVLKRFLTYPVRNKVFHNYFIEYHAFANHGIYVDGLFCDTLALSRLCDPEREGGHKLDGNDGVAVGLLGRPRDSRPTTRQALDTYKLKKNGEAGKQSEFIGMRRIVADPEMLPFQIFYACNDTVDTIDLKGVIIDMLYKIEWNNDDPRGLWGFYEDWYREYQEVLAKQMRRGICVDIDYTNVVKEEFLLHLEKLKGEFNEWAGCEVNLNSTPQIGWLLYGEGWRNITKKNVPVFGHGLPIPDVRPKDKARKEEFLKSEDKFPSADKDALEFLLENTDGDDRAAVKALAEYSKHDTIVTLTINSMLHYNVARHASGHREYDELLDWCRYVHSSFDMSTATGRLTSAKPNLQQIPSRGKLGVITRHAFTCEPGQLMIVGDWSQVELRILAYYAKKLCGDMSLAIDLMAGDLHQNTADKLGKILGRKVERVTAKSINFGINYGMSAMKLSADMGITLEEAEELINQYLAIYPGIGLYADTMIAYAREHGHVRTLLGRIRVLRNINARYAKARMKDERRARNTPIQGSAQDVCMIAMNNIEKDEELKDYGYEMLFAVHDELVGITKKPQYEKEIIARKKFLMENAIPAEMLDGIPLIADLHAGTTWQESKSGEAFADPLKIAA